MTSNSQLSSIPPSNSAPTPRARKARKYIEKFKKAIERSAVVLSLKLNFWRAPAHTKSTDPEIVNELQIVQEPEGVWEPEAADGRYVELKQRAGRFRVLIIGGANAGKTTILKKVCNTTDEPEIYNGDGTKVDERKLEPTNMRGEHDIENEMVFRSNPDLIFHDSRGFEAGGVDEFEKAKNFVAESARSKRMNKQVHVIWYCIAMDDDRPITYAENQFFSVSGTGKVPVIVVFTKCEGLEIKAITTLEEGGYDFDEAADLAPEYAKKEVKRIQDMLAGMEYPPKGYVYLQELEKPENDCQVLVKCTVDVLDSDILQGLFISTQQNSLELAMEYSLRNSLQIVSSFEGGTMSSELITQMFKRVLEYFPYHVSN